MNQVRKKPKIILFLMALMLCSLPAADCAAEEGPDTVELDSLTQYYDSVMFDHASHLEFAEGNCAECHHHTTGSPPKDPRCGKCHTGGQEADSLACRDCHSNNRFDAAYLAEIAADPSLYHIDKPGVKGAFHTKCMGCHRENGGPTGCQGCHTRNEKGDEFFHSGSFAPAPKKTNESH